MTRFLSILAIVFVAVGCSERETAVTPLADAGQLVTLDETAQRRAGISVATVQATPRAEQTAAPGVIALDERRTARIGSLVEGVLLETNADVGARVAAGQILATMHSTGLISAPLGSDLARGAVLLTATALAAIGGLTDPAALRQAGARPLLLGTVLWLTVTAASLLAQTVL